VGVTFVMKSFALQQKILEPTKADLPIGNDAYGWPMITRALVAGPYESTGSGDTPTRRAIFTCTPGASMSDTACAEQILGRLAVRAYGRPLNERDTQTLRDLYARGSDNGRNFEAGVQLGLARILSGPEFLLYHGVTEDGAAAEGEKQDEGVTLASRLALFLWNSIPDDALREDAVAGRLADAKVLEAQVRRLLADPRAATLVSDFAEQWLQLRLVNSKSPDPRRFPSFDDNLRRDMLHETELFLTSVLLEDKSVLDLLRADYTFVNERLAAHYGMPNIYGSQFRRITLGPDMDIRRGLLGKGAFLTTTSKPDRTSPVTRGKWIMTNIFGMSPPDPPPNVPPLPARATDARGSEHEPTMREKMLEHRVRADCVQCHRMMDPIGFALENFDAVGLWRTTDEGTAVDPSAQLFDNTMVDGPVALRQWVTRYSSQFVRVSIEKLLTYALGRGLDYQDMPLVRSVARDVAQKDDRFSALVLAVVRSAPFQTNTKTE
jgi:hypothetical protein